MMAEVSDNEEGQQTPTLEIPRILSSENAPRPEAQEGYAEDNLFDPQFGSKVIIGPETALYEGKQLKRITQGGSVREVYDLSDEQVLIVPRAGHNDGQLRSDLYVSLKFGKTGKIAPVDKWGVMPDGKICIVKEKVVPLQHKEDVSKSKVPKLRERIQTAKQLPDTVESQATVSQALSEWGLRKEEDINQLEDLIQFMQRDLRLVDGNVHQVGYNKKGSLVVFDYAASVHTTEDEAEKFFAGLDEKIKQIGGK